MTTKTNTKPATQLNTGDRIRYADMHLEIVGAYYRNGYGTGVKPSPYAEHQGTTSELHSFAKDLQTGGRVNITFAADAAVELA